MAYPSTFLSIQDEVMGELRLDTGDRSKVKDWINQAYAQVATETEAFQTWTALPTSPDFGTYTLPAAIARIKSIIPAGDDAGELSEVSRGEILALRQGGQVGTNDGAPMRYALLGMNQLELWPTPSSVGPLHVYYVYLPNALTTDGQIPELGEPWNAKLLKYGALLEAGRFVRVADKEDYQAIYDNWTSRFIRHLNRRGGSGTGQLAVAGAPVVSHRRDIDLGY